MKAHWVRVLTDSRADAAAHPLHQLYVRDIKVLLVLAASQFMLIGAYKVLHGSTLFSADLLRTLPWASFIPYLRWAQEPISEASRAAVGLYYVLAAAIFGACIARFWISRTGTLKVKNLLLFVAALGVFGWVWAIGDDYRRTHMSGFHRGEVFGHFKYMALMVSIVAIGCIAVFRNDIDS
jgi:hypothetical protein